MGNVLLAILLWAATLSLPVFAWGQDCSGATPNDVCAIPDKTALPPASHKIASAVREAVDGVLAYVPSAKSRGLEALSTAVTRINVAGEIHVYVILTDFRPEYVAQLETMGLRVEQTLPDVRLIQGWAPANLVDLIAGFDFVVEVKPPGYAVSKAGVQLTTGDSILRADTARATFGVTGAGVKVGVMSDGVNHLAQSVATGDLPAGVQVLKNPGGDEGTAMLEIVHDLAPGAALAFYGPTTSADMVVGINALAAAGARVVVDDLTFLDEPKFQDGMIAQAARNFATGGKIYVTSAGNEARNHYRAAYNRLAGQNIPTAVYPATHNYLPSPGSDIGNTFTLPANCNVRVVLQWNNPNGGSTDDFDLFLLRTSDGAILAQSINSQTGTQNALETLTFTNTSGAPMAVSIAVSEFRLVNPSSSLILDYFIFERCGIGSGAGFRYVTSADSVIGHAAVNEVLSVAALSASTPTQAESYSSRGPGSISFPTPETRSVPNVSGIDCVTTEVGVLGFFANPFCGTSAAAPHVAAIAALLIQLNPAMTSQALRNALTGTSIDLGSPGFDFTFGSGRVDAVNGTGSVAPPFTLTVTRTGTGAGTVASSPAGIDCGATCTGAFAFNTSVTLTATPAAGSVFAGWNGGGCSGILSCTVTVAAATTVTATLVAETTSAVSLVAAVLPSSRSVQVGISATAFATIINPGPGTSTVCSLAPAASVAAAFVFQTTDPATNQVTGTPNTPVDIPEGVAQSFVFAFTPTAPIAPTNVPLAFDCANTTPAVSRVGLNTFLLSASATPIPDIVALAATLTNNGVVNVAGATGTGVFAVATVNVGSDGTVTASADTGGVSLPLTVTLCQTNPASGQCLGPAGPAVTTTITANATPTFGIFVQGLGGVAFDPANNRIVVRFTDVGGVTRGSTSVAVTTQ
ncbi:MAG: hypothetical protein DMD91_14845 [Candidatus Rokuibacteriota bacterium]|nr:MAG: hypothetical protein DMD91_14845 [Candidatus Rokubacteria bacterium]